MRSLRRPIAVAIFVLAAPALAVWISAGDAHAARPAGMDPGIAAFSAQNPGSQIPVVFRTHANPDSFAAEVSREGAAEVTPLNLIGGVAASVTPEELSHLSHDSDVEWVALDVPVASSTRDGHDDGRASFKDVYPYAAGAPGAWSADATGEDVTVAVIDSGIGDHEDFQGRVHARFDMSSVSNGVRDDNGHGTYIAGIIGGRGKDYAGMAPNVRLLSLRVSGDDGRALASDVVAALQWVVDHKDERNIRVVNISLTAIVPDSYQQDPIDAAVEQAWLHGIVVVVSAGNYGTESFSTDHAPANDPFVITVGAFDDQGTPDRSDDSIADWSSRGITSDGYAKPEIVAPGVAVTSTLAKHSLLAQEHPSAVVDKRYITMDGTSASAAIVSGAAALLLSNDPSLTPGQVKYRLMHTGAGVAGSGAPSVDAGAAVGSAIMGDANAGAVLNELIDPFTGDIMYDSVLWRSVLWRSVLWRSVEEAVLWRG